MYENENNEKCARTPLFPHYKVSWHIIVIFDKCKICQDIPRTKLVPPEKNQALETIEESSIPEQIEEPELSELEMEIESPRCNEIMELCSSFDKLVYSCESCSFVLKCV